DTPGMRLASHDEIQRAQHMLPPREQGAVVHLTLSAFAKDQDTSDLAKRFMNLNPSDLAFTSIDLSGAHGVIYNTQRETRLPLHSFGIGSRIPEDFEIASKDRVMDLLFKTAPQMEIENFKIMTLNNEVENG